MCGKGEGCGGEMERVVEFCKCLLPVAAGGETPAQRGTCRESGVESYHRIKPWRVGVLQ